MMYAALTGEKEAAKEDNERCQREVRARRREERTVIDANQPSEVLVFVEDASQLDDAYVTHRPSPSWKRGCNPLGSAPSLPADHGECQ
jgi:hypothetical protein